MHSRTAREKPHWWPENEPWPPRDEMHQWRAGRRRFFRRAAFIAFIALGLAILGLFTVIRFLVASFEAGAPAASQTALLIALAFVPFALIAILLTRVRGAALNLRHVMDAADRVAAGNYETGVIEKGPYSQFRNLARSFNTMTERLAQNDRQRRDFMADVAHELRTPLTIIQGKLEGMMDGIYPIDRSQLETLVDETHVLARLVDDLQTLALSESGTLKLQIESVDAEELVRDAVRALAPEARARNVTLDVEARSAVPAMEIDPVRIREVLTNLLSNAVSHTPPGGSVTVRIEPATNGDVAIAVRDTGYGMTAEEISRAFDRFYKGTGSRGSGLGLTIAKNLVEAHGGTIKASSEPGSGTTVTFSLPREH